MIKKLDRYIARTVIGTTLLILFALLCMDFFIQIMNELDDIGKGSYGLLQALLYVCLILPRDIYQLFPMAGLVGCLMGLGLLASNSELIVMRAAGMSLAQITRAVLMGILLMIIVVTVLGEGFAPRLLLHAERLKALDRSNGQALATQQGVWLRDKNNFIHIESVEATDTLNGVTRYQFTPTHQLTEVAFAEHAKYHGGQWNMQGINRSILHPNGEVSTDKADNSQWTMELNPSVLKIAQIEPDEMNLLKLHQWIHYRKANQLRYSNDALVFWQRIFQPVSTSIMMLLAIPFIFGPLRSATTGIRLVAGVIVGFGFYILNQMLGTISLTYQFPPFLGAVLPLLLFLSLLLWYVRSSHDF